ncbi:MAG: DNA repair protein RadC [Treponema sp.]|nr:DNA repair protein RadC [Treponema sp.]
MIYEIISERKMKNPGKLDNPEDAYELVKRYAGARQEQFMVVTLNTAHEPVSVSIATIGTVNRTLIHPREIFYRAVRDMACAIIVCHNHPSGSLEPSQEDKEVTVSLYEAGKILGIHVLDHIIITRKGFLSLRKEGYFPEPDRDVDG